MLTEIDLFAEKRISEKLASFDKSIAVVGEESGGDRSAQKYWLVDPIDGTIHFVRGIPFCTMMVALIENDIPIAAGVYNIITAEYVYAAKGRGAFIGDDQIHITPRPVKEAVILTEIGQNALNGKMTLQANFRSVNLMCAGYEFLLVATGKIDARVVIDALGKDYDFAPGLLICGEAGCSVVSLDDKHTVSQHDRNFVVANSSELSDYICKLVKHGR